jgi:pSer/pThr/pTyr-binding forkhead associated (FHA) protein
LFITLLAIVYILLRRGREMGSASVAVETDAFINDIHNYTASSQYQLSKKPTMFGRVAGKDTAHLNYLVIPESTIGRRHALIEYKDYGFWISDQGSINGTFVNDKMISSEVCLKHGDKVRLHKFEFEFTMPEMDDAGKTVMSGAHDASSGIADAATVVSNSHSEDAEIEVPDMEFDITGGADVDFELEMDEADGSENMGVEDDDEDETLIREDGKTDESESNAEAEPDFDSEDETLMPGGPEVRQAGAEESVDDETLMRGSFDGDDDEDMTIRKEGEESGDDFFDIGADDDTNNK